MWFMIMWMAIAIGTALAIALCKPRKTKKHPVVISHHVKAIGMEYPEDALIRINLAWIAGGIDEVHEILKGLGDHKVYLDYPTGRTKPPKPSMSLEDACVIANNFNGKITHFAFSNAWDAASIEQIEDLRNHISKYIKLVPKIETKGGVNHLEEIVEAAKTDMVMLDAEDLYVNCKHNPKIFNQYKEKCRKRCKELGIVCIELKGVVFGYES